MVDYQDLLLVAESFKDVYEKHPVVMATAESCTGGLISSLITEVSGSSQWFDRAFVTYTNEAKVDLLKVSKDIIAKYGAVSEQTALMMAEGAVMNSNADIAVAVTGIAGPTGGTPDKPVGTVCIAFKVRGCEPFVKRHLFSGDRRHVRYETAMEALSGLKTLALNQSAFSKKTESPDSLAEATSDEAYLVKLLSELKFTNYTLPSDWPK